jgi:thiamine biosynthesis lipoprotein
MSPTRRKLLIGGAGALACAAGGAAGLNLLAGKHGLEARTRAGVAFGTTVALTFAGPGPRALDAAIAEGFATIRAAERAASLLRPDSALSRLNRAGRLDDPDPHLVALTRFALALAEDSGGAFDPTVQPYWPLWAKAAEAGRRPDEAERRAAAARVGWRGVQVCDEGITFARPGMAMTLNGLLQGYAADLVVARAKALGVENAFVDTGEFAAYGASPEGRPWRLGGGDPDAAVVADPFVGFASTSAGAGAAFSADGTDNHIFDPRTGFSPRNLRSVTAFAPSGIEADGLSTAALVLGPEAATALAARRPGCSLRLAA